MNILPLVAGEVQTLDAVATTCLQYAVPEATMGEFRSTSMAEVFAKVVELAVDVAETPDDAQVQIQITKQQQDRNWYLAISIPGAGTDGRALEDCGLTQQEQDALKAACLKMLSHVLDRAGYVRKTKVAEPIKEDGLGGEVEKRG